MDGGRKTQNISLQPAEWVALRLLAQDERDNKISPAVARLIEKEMRSRFGPNWRDAVAVESANGREVVSVR